MAQGCGDYNLPSLREDPGPPERLLGLGSSSNVELPSWVVLPPNHTGESWLPCWGRGMHCCLWLRSHSPVQQLWQGGSLSFPQHMACPVSFPGDSVPGSLDLVALLAEPER